MIGKILLTAEKRGRRQLCIAITNNNTASIFGSERLCTKEEKAARQWGSIQALHSGKIHCNAAKYIGKYWQLLLPSMHRRVFPLSSQEKQIWSLTEILRRETLDLALCSKATPSCLCFCFPSFFASKFFSLDLLCCKPGSCCSCRWGVLLFTGPAGYTFPRKKTSWKMPRYWRLRSAAFHAKQMKQCYARPLPFIFTLTCSCQCWVFQSQNLFCSGTRKESLLIVHLSTFVQVKMKPFDLTLLQVHNIRFFYQAQNSNHQHILFFAFCLFFCFFFTLCDGITRIYCRMVHIYQQPALFDCSEFAWNHVCIQTRWLWKSCEQPSILSAQQCGLWEHLVSQVKQQTMNGSFALLHNCRDVLSGSDFLWLNSRAFSSSWWKRKRHHFFSRCLKGYRRFVTGNLCTCLNGCHWTMLQQWLMKLQTLKMGQGSFSLFRMSAAISRDGTHGVMLHSCTCRVCHCGGPPPLHWAGPLLWANPPTQPGQTPPTWRYKRFHWHIQLQCPSGTCTSSFEMFTLK